MAYKDLKDLPKTTASDKASRDKASNVAENYIDVKNLLM